MNRIMILFFVLLMAKFLPAQTANSGIFVLGKVDSLQSNILSETRALNIYLPEGYSPDSVTKYPVIYLLDGSADEDFIHVVGLIQYFNFPWIDAVPKSIVVGVSNVNRKRDFTFKTSNLAFVQKMGYDTLVYSNYGGSEKFISFIENELKPYMDKHYKTTPQSTIIGQSLGGLLATEILLSKPYLFNKYIIISPSLWWDNESLLDKARQLSKMQNNHPIQIHISIGKEGKTMIHGAKKLYQSIKKYGNKNNKVYFEYLSKEDHASISHLAIYRALKLLY